MQDKFTESLSYRLGCHLCSTQQFGKDSHSYNEAIDFSHST